MAVDVPDFGPTFGEDWRDLDAMEVGEMWLRAMLGLRLADAEGEAAAAGWDGAVYRAWTDGEDVAVILSSEWDSPREAREFRATLASWIAEGRRPRSSSTPTAPASTRGSARART